MTPTPKEVLVIWDAAVAAHREYWQTLDSGKMVSDELRTRDRAASTVVVLSTDLDCPDAVATGR